MRSSTSAVRATLLKALEPRPERIGAERGTADEQDRLPLVRHAVRTEDARSLVDGTREDADDVGVEADRDHGREVAVAGTPEPIVVVSRAGGREPEGRAEE